MKEMGLASGTLYPLLDRLVCDAWVETRWVESPVPGRPPRHMYRLTATGRAEARAALARLSPQRAGRLGLEGA